MKGRVNCNVFFVCLPGKSSITQFACIIFIKSVLFTLAICLVGIFLLLAGMKYDLRKVEEVYYDVKIRGLTPNGESVGNQGTEGQS